MPTEPETPPPLRLGIHPDRPERLAVIRPDGSPAAWFAPDATLAEALAELERATIEVTVDDDAR
jgi:hypothetical protein